MDVDKQAWLRARLKEENAASALALYDLRTALVQVYYKWAAESGLSGRDETSHRRFADIAGEEALLTVLLHEYAVEVALFGHATFVAAFCTEAPSLPARLGEQIRKSPLVSDRAVAQVPPILSRIRSDGDSAALLALDGEFARIAPAVERRLERFALDAVGVPLPVRDGSPAELHRKRVENARRQAGAAPAAESL